MRAAWALFLMASACAGSDDPDQPYACRPPECVAPAQAYGAEIVIPDGTAVPSTEFGHVDLNETTGAFALNVPAAVLVRGVVLSGGAPVPATVVATRPSRISGRPDVFYQSIVDETDGTYHILVPPNIEGESYTVRVSPNEPTRYPPISSTVSVKEEQPLDFDIPSGEALVHLRGTITDALQTAVGDARVSVRDALLQTDLSTTGRTDENGHFEISLPLDVKTYGGASLALSVTSGDVGKTNTGLLSMVLTVAPAELKAKLVEDALGLQLPAVPSKTHLSYRVVGMGSNGIDQNIAGASVRLRTNLVDPTRLGNFTVRHEVQTTTNSEGKIEVDLYSDQMGARTYEVAISPTGDSEFQASSTTITVGVASGVGAPIRLQQRKIITGRVLDASGMPLKNVVIQPAIVQSTAATAASTSLATSPSLSNATTDSDGRFALRVDAGNYEFAVIPPASAHLPRRWLPGIQVVGDVDLGSLVAPMPVTFDALVVRADGMPISATVRLFGIPAANSGCESGNTNCVLPPRLQAEAMTGSDGHATLLLATE